MKKRIIIVGAGYAGITLARALDGWANVVLVEPREAFVHNVAAIRSIVQPELLDRLIIPYDRLLKHGEIIKARANRIEVGRVILGDRGTVEGDIVIIATGSTYARPFKPQSDFITEFRSQQHETYEAIKAAQSIAVVGAGPVGVEMAAEIASASPKKRVTILAGSNDVVPGVSAKLSRALRGQLVDLGIELRLGAVVEGIQEADAPFAGDLHAGGETVSSDLVIPVFGARPAQSPLRHAAIAASGRLAVDRWMRPNGHENIFAIGDAADNGDQMTIVAVRRQTAWLIKTLKAVLSGGSIEALPPYSAATKPLLLVPLGLNSGSSILPVSRAGWLAGPRLTQKIKGRDLFIESTRKELNY